LCIYECIEDRRSYEVGIVDDGGGWNVGTYITMTFGGNIQWIA
jgi:hypothetical protein